MPIAPTLHRYLASENIQYNEIPHVYTMSPLTMFAAGVFRQQGGLVQLYLRAHT